MLADLGAEVTKLEAIGHGDDSRHFGPYLGEESVYFAMLNRNKRSVAVDFKNPAAKSVVAALVAKSDVVVENFRPGVAKRLGLDYATLSTISPSIIYLSISGFGQADELAQRPAYDLVIQAMSGLMSTTGENERGPLCVGESIADVATGMFGAFAIASALYARERHGVGQHIDLAMFDAMMSMQITGLSRLAASGEAPKRVGNQHPMTAPVDTYPTRDGSIALVVPSDYHFKKLCGLMGKDELVVDPRFVDNRSRRENSSALNQIIIEWTSSQTSAQVVQACVALDLACGPVNDLKQAKESTRSGHRRVFSAVDHPTFGQLDMALQPAQFSNCEPVPTAREPKLGEHTIATLRELGFTAQAIEQLMALGAVAG
jgi:CoA:oxalate CoA-transferase